MEFHYATVVENVDPDKLGRVQIKIKYLHDACDDALLPWAKQFSLTTGGSATYGSSSIPEVDSLVWVWFPDEADLKKPYYIADIQLKGMSPHMLFEDNVKSKITGFASAYPDVKFQYLKNGICFGATSGDNPEYFIVHPTGAVIYINKDGDIDIKDKNANEVKMTTTGINIKDKNSNEINMIASGVEINGNTKTFVTGIEMNAAMTSLNGQLTTYFTALYALLGTPFPGIVFDMSAAQTVKLKTGA